MTNPPNTSAGKHDAKEILVTGTFDVRNYGDLLFPLIAGARLSPHGIVVKACSPSGLETGWADCMAPLSPAAMSEPRFPLKGILVGGGNIVHAKNARLTEYRLGDLSDWAYSSLWLGASIAGAIHNIPVAWNAPGVPAPLPKALAEHVFMPQLAEACEYFSVRDAASVNNLGLAGQRASIVPDTAVDLASLWPRKSLEPDFAALIERKAMSRDARFMTVHVKERSVSTALAELGTQIGEFATAHNLVPILLALAPCHDDDVAARHVARFIKGPKVVVDDVCGLREVAGAIANAQLHLGASLHGYITAAAYDVPSVLVAQPKLEKYDGFLAQIDRSDDLVETWEAALPRAAEQLGEKLAAPMLPTAVHAAADAHWAKVAAAFLTPRRTQVERTRFLRSYLRYGINREDLGWMLRPASRDA